MAAISNPSNFRPLAGHMTKKAPSEAKKAGSSGGWDIPQDTLTDSIAGAPGLLIPHTASTGTTPSPLVPQRSINRFEEAEVSKHQADTGWGETARKMALAGALGAVSLVGIANAAQAQVVTVSTQQQVRHTEPVRVKSPEEAVEQFSAENQLYVIGNPSFEGALRNERTPYLESLPVRTPINLDDFEAVLKDHPNIYVVINGDYVDDLNESEIVVGSGIGKSDEFMSVRHQTTGEKNGVVFYINLNVNREQQPTGRATLMRAEGLADEVGVGDGRGGDGFDAWFPNGRPGKLGSIFVDSFANDEKSLARSMDDVFEVINSTIDQHAEGRLTTAQNQVQSADRLMTQAQAARESFQQLHGEGGQLGSPSVEVWQRLSREMHSALEDSDLSRVAELHDTLSAELKTYKSGTEQYLQAAQGRGHVEQSMSDLSKLLARMPENSEAALAREAYSEARDAVLNYQVALDAKDLNTGDKYRDARMMERRVRASIQDSFDAQALKRNTAIGATAAVGLGLLAAGYVAHKKASKQEEQASAQLLQVQAEIRDYSDKLLTLLDSTDYDTVAGLTGESKELSDRLMASSLNALTLVGGVEKFVAEARSAIEGKNLVQKVRNYFSSGNFTNAQQLMRTDESGKSLSFETKDSQLALLDKDRTSAVWREKFLKAGQSEEMEANLNTLLKQMVETHAVSGQLKADVVDTSAAVLDYHRGMTALGKESYELQKAGIEDGLFTGGTVSSEIIPRELPQVEYGGIQHGDHVIPLTDPVRAHRDAVKPNERLFRDSVSVIEAAGIGRYEVVPTIADAESTLHPHEVKTDWAQNSKEELSQRLFTAARKIREQDISEETAAIKAGLNELSARVKTTVEQDVLRRETLPQNITEAEAQVDASRRELFVELQNQGFFQHGTSEKMLREDGRDPSAHLRAATSDLSSLKPRLDQGDVEGAGTLIQSVQDKTQSAQEIVQQSRQALESYPSNREARQKGYESLNQRLSEETKPALQRIQSAYSPVVMKQVAQDLGVGQTLATKYDDASASLTRSNNLAAKAAAQIDQAQILASQDSLNSAASAQESAAFDITAVVKAEQTLAEKQKLAEEQTPASQARLKSLKELSLQPFARTRGRGFLEQAETKLAEAKKIVALERKSPYDALSGLAVTAGLLQQAEVALEGDKQSYEKATGSIRSTESSLNESEKALKEVRDWDNSVYVSGYGTVSVTLPNLTPYREKMNDAQAKLTKAKGALDATDFEEATALAEVASGLLAGIPEALAGVLRSAMSDLEQKVAEARRRVRSSSSSSSSSSGGGYSRTGRTRRGGSSSGSSGSWGSGSSGSSSSSSSSSGGGYKRTGRTRRGGSSSGSSHRSGSSSGSSGHRGRSSSGSSGHRSGSSWGGSGGHRSGSSRGSSGHRGGRSSGGSSGGW